MKMFKNLKNAKEKSKNKKVKVVGNILTMLLILLFLVVVIQSLTTRINKNYIPRILGSTYLNVLSGSMAPQLEKNDLAIGVKVKDASNLKVGDVITYKDVNMLVTHRIVEVNDNGGSFITKGDANKDNDEKIVSREQIVSKYAFKIPKGGYVVSKLQNTTFLLLVWIIVMYFIVKEIFVELKKERLGKESKEIM